MAEKWKKYCPLAMSVSRYYNELSIKVLVKWWESVCVLGELVEK
jgi:hypothetical protein